MENDTTTLAFDEEMLQGILQNMTEGNMTSNSSMLVNPHYIYANPQLPEWVPNVYLALLCFAIAVGVPGNLITALAYFIVKNKTNSDWYIFFVAAFDLASCVIRVSGKLLEFLDIWAKLTNADYCRFVGWISQTSVCMSFFTLGFIAIDRYIKVCLYSSLNITAKQSRNICLVLMAVTFIFGSPTLILFSNSPRGICTVATDLQRKKWVKVYYCTIYLLFLIMMVAVIYCYLSIAWKVWKTGRTIGLIHRPPAPPTVSTSVTGKRTCSTDIEHNKHSPDNRSKTINDPSVKKSPSKNRLQITFIPDAPGLFVIPGIQRKVSVEPSKANRNVKDNSKNKLKIPENQRARRQKRDYKVTGLLFMVTTVFIISWIPPCVAAVKAFFIGYATPMTVSDYITLIYAPNFYILHNFANPIIYISLSCTYRNKVKHLFKKISDFFLKS